MEETQCTKTEAIATVQNEVNWACQDDCCDINHSESPDVYPRLYDVWAEWCIETTIPVVCTGESKQIYACNKSHAVSITNPSNTRQCFKRVGKKEVLLDRVIVHENKYGVVVDKERPMHSEYPHILFPLGLIVLLLSIFALLNGGEAYCDCKQCEHERTKIRPALPQEKNDKQINAA